MNICVLGSGIVGLTTALELQSAFPNAAVTIIADAFNEETVSYVAAGIFRPGTSFSGPTEEITYQWSKDSYDYWEELRRSKDADLAGVAELSGYIFSSTSPAIVRNHFLEKVLPVYRRATVEELRLCAGDWKYGSFFTTCLTENRLFLPYAAKKFIANGGIVMKKHINSFAEVPKYFDIIVNCTGLGAQELCEDKKLVAIRGQVIKVRAPWVKMAFYGDYDTYILPGFDAVTLGGVRQFESYNKNLCPYDSMAIKERCYNLLPSLRNAEVINQYVGLRPYRTVVRVESEVKLRSDGSAIKIVHNYGHGGYGVTMAPGTAKYATELVRSALKSKSML